MHITFGTDGWRAIIAEDFTFENLKLVTGAIATYIKNSEDPGEGVVVGYDQRFLSEQFAEAVAEILGGNGLKVYLTSKPTPTPVTAFAIKHWKCKGGIMLTASHNPATYHGIKYIPYFAGPALPETTKKIEEALHQIAQNKEEIKGIKFSELENQGLVEKIDPQEPYLNHLKEIIDISAIKDNPAKIIIDPMYGAGIGYIEKFLEDSGCEVAAIHNYRDPLFGGGMPEPKEDQLGELKTKVLQEKAKLGLALDGDADRFGVIDKNGEYITPNQILSLVLDHLITGRGWEGPVARTVSTTHTLDNICEIYGTFVKETPVGFKYIGQALREGCILGGEESGGLSIKGHIPEKDGILACLLILEILCASEKSISENLQDLKEKYGGFVSRRLDLKVEPEQKEELQEIVKAYEPVKILGKPVVERITVDGTKIKLADGSWVLIRPSGTEPLFRIYAEAPTMDDVEAMQMEVKGEVFGRKGSIK